MWRELRAKLSLIFLHRTKSLLVVDNPSFHISAGVIFIKVNEGSRFCSVLGFGIRHNYISSYISRNHGGDVIRQPIIVLSMFRSECKGVFRRWNSEDSLFSSFKVVSDL